MLNMRRLGWWCLALGLAAFAPAAPLRCTGGAAIVGGCALIDGALFGAVLALVTRTRRPIGIYALLGCAVLTLWPLVVGWPPAPPRYFGTGTGDGEPGCLYLDGIRVLLFFCAAPCAFGWLGFHAPDPVPASPTCDGAPDDKGPKYEETSL